MAGKLQIRDRVKELRRVRASELLPHPQNWRRHGKVQREALSGVLSELGFADAVLARETPGGLQLIDGHLRQDIMGDAVVPVLVLDLDAAEAEKLLLTLDPLAAMAEQDVDVLAELLATVRFENEAVNEMLAQLADGDGDALAPGEPPEDPGPQLDRAAELQQKWGTTLGQIWEIPSKGTPGKAHRLMCGDSTKAEDVARLMDGNRAAMVWTDPPYGIAYQAVGGDSIAGDITFTAIPLLFAFLDSVLDPGGWVYVCGGSANLSLYARMFEYYLRLVPRVIVWDKGAMTIRHNGYHSAYEFIYVGFKQGGGDRWYHERAGEPATDIWRIPKPTNAARQHLTEKPVELPLRALRNSCPEGGLVYDPFLGSGTTMVAAEQTSRLCYGMEIEPKYIAVALERVSGLGLEPRLVSD